jgi:hypothetical protein
MKSYSLMDLLAGDIEQDENGKTRSKRLDGISIPSIQRDYAQGRDEEKRIRDKFLDVLFATMTSGDGIVLDFVYGSIDRIDENQYFIPLDGQQRLTTLFLLHCYVSERELDGEKLKAHRTALGHFSYATRYVSRQFCEKLAQGNWSVSPSPRKSIMNQPWFYSVYSNDPTVRSMLTMLEAIHEQYERSGKNLIDKLGKLRFYILLLDKFGLSDALYIKMNARGKQLDQFENFKADLLNWMQDEINPAREGLLANTQYQNRVMTYRDAFDLKLDREWINFFWKYQHSEDERDKEANASFLRFWNRYILTRIIVQDGGNTDALIRSKHFDYLFRASESSLSKYSDFSWYRDFFSDVSSFYIAEKVLDAFANISLEQDLRGCATGDDKEFEFTGQKFTFKMRLLFSALVFFFERTQFADATTRSGSLKKWMRVVGNIVQDPDIRDVSVVVSLSKLLYQLSAGCDDFYKYLASLDLSTLERKSFIDTILKEEQLKARLIIDDVAWEAELVAAERHPLFQGNIYFLIEDFPTIELFKQRRERAVFLFDGKGPRIEYNKMHEVIRACISDIPFFVELANLNYEDSDRNWQLLLRRNERVRFTIRNMCSLPISDDLQTFISVALFRTSSIDVQRYRAMHVSLYKDIDIQCWMQANAATSLKIRGGQYYACRPGSWYDWLCLTGPRESLINVLIDQYSSLKTDHRIGDSRHFWGKTIELIGTDVYLGLKLIFDEGNGLFVCIPRGANNIKGAAVNNQFSSDENWLAYCRFTLPASDDDGEIADLKEEISHKIFNEENPESLFCLFLKVSCVGD